MKHSATGLTTTNLDQFMQKKRKEKYSVYLFFLGKLILFNAQETLLTIEWQPCVFIILIQFSSQGATLSHHNIVNNAYMIGLRMNYHKKYARYVHLCHSRYFSTQVTPAGSAALPLSTTAWAVS